MDTKLRPYQLDLIQILQKAISEKKGGLVQWATGLGKTYTLMHFLANYFYGLKVSRILFIADQYEPIKGAAKTFKEFGVEVYPSFVTGKTKDTSGEVVFATAQTMRNFMHTLPKDYFSLIIWDEAHHAGATTYFSILDYFDSAVRLGLTATPWRTDGVQLSTIFGGVIDDKDIVFGILNDYLKNPQYEVIIDDIDPEVLIELQSDHTSLTKEEISQKLFIPKKDEELILEILEREKRHNVFKTIIFAQNIDHANYLKDYFFSEDDETQVLHSDISYEDRETYFGLFQSGGVKRLIVVNMMNEYFHVEGVGLVVMWRSTQSPVIWYQQLGRGLAKDTFSDNLFILDYVSNIERMQNIQDLQRRLEEGYEPPSQQTLGCSPHTHTVIDTPFKFSFSTTYVNIQELLIRHRILRFGFYETWQEASDAIQMLKRIPRRYRAYKKLYRQDPMLPSDPTYIYADFPGWKIYLKATFYETWQEASYAIQLLNPIPTSAKEYTKMRKQDPRLPSTPSVVYPDFPGYILYLRLKYWTWQEAAQAIRKLSKILESINQYRTLYAEDPKLVVNPDTFYSDFPGWDKYLGITTGKKRRVKIDAYQTWQEASGAVQKLTPVPRSMRKYYAIYKTDPQLPSEPGEFYDDYPGYKIFLKLEDAA